MSLAYICARCDDCEEAFPARRVHVRDGIRRCPPCARAFARRRCDRCRHPLSEHSAFGCLVETAADVFCACGPPALAELRP